MSFRLLCDQVESSDEEEKRNGQEQAVCRRRKEDDCDVEITTSTLQGDLPSPVDSPEHCCATLVVRETHTTALLEHICVYYLSKTMYSLK